MYVLQKKKLIDLLFRIDSDNETEQKNYDMEIKMSICLSHLMQFAPTTLSTDFFYVAEKYDSFD